MSSLNSKVFLLNCEKDTEKLAINLAQALTHKLTQKVTQKIQNKQSFNLYLSGNLGAGKTTFIRYLINALGYSALVKSPTYSLIESYKINEFKLFHLDLYRLNDFDELEDLDYKDCFNKGHLVLIEWPDFFLAKLPHFDLMMNFYFNKPANQENDKFSIDQSRKIKLESQSMNLAKINLE